MKKFFVSVLLLGFGFVVNLQAGVVDVIIEGGTNVHAFARAELSDWGIIETNDAYDTMTTMASALAMHGYWEGDEWIYFDQLLEKIPLKIFLGLLANVFLGSIGVLSISFFMSCIPLPVISSIFPVSGSKSKVLIVKSLE